MVDHKHSLSISEPNKQKNQKESKQVAIHDCGYILISPHEPSELLNDLLFPPVGK